MFWDYVATEFDRFDDLALGGKRWFPTRYRIAPKNTTEIVLENIRINPAIPDSRFTPEIADGTLVTDEPATPNQVSSFAGGEAGYEAYKRRVHEATQKALSLGGPMVDATRDHQWTWPILFVVSLATLVIACGLWWRARSRG